MLIDNKFSGIREKLYDQLVLRANIINIAFISLLIGVLSRKTTFCNCGHLIEWI